MFYKLLFGLAIAVTLVKNSYGDNSTEDSAMQSLKNLLTSGGQ